MARIVRDTTVELTIEGLDALEPGTPYLFLSNHRDIVMDSALLNFRLHQAGHRTARVAVGDNLLTERYAADLMRLNKSFVIERGVTSATPWRRASRCGSPSVKAGRRTVTIGPSPRC